MQKECETCLGTAIDIFKMMIISHDERTKITFQLITINKTLIVLYRKFTRKKGRYFFMSSKIKVTKSKYQIHKL